MSLAGDDNDYYADLRGDDSECDMPYTSATKAKVGHW